MTTKFFIYRAVNLLTGKPVDVYGVGNWRGVFPENDEEYDYLFDYYANYYEEPDPFRYEIREFETPSEVDMTSLTEKGSE